jgi:hypothetical protein
MKDAGMRIRLEPELRERFLNVCREQDLPAAQVLRQFMRGYVEQFKPKEQSTLNQDGYAKRVMRKR